MKWNLATLVFLVLTGTALRAEPDLAGTAANREKIYDNVRISYRLTSLTKAGSRSLDPKNPMPKEDIALQSSGTIWYSGSFNRIEYSHPLINLETGKPSDTKSVIGVTGPGGTKEYHPQGLGSGSVAKGFVEGSNAFLIIPIFKPLHMFFRGQDVSLCGQHSVNDFKKTGVTIVANKTKLNEFKKSLSASDWTLLFADDSKDCLVHRIDVYRNGGLTSQFRIDYSPGEMLPVPKRITHDLYSRNEKIEETYTLLIDTIEKLDSVDKDKFDIQFPEGTEIYNEKAKKYGNTNAQGEVYYNDPSPGSNQLRENWITRNYVHYIFGLVLLLLALWLVKARFAKRSST